MVSGAGSLVAALAIAAASFLAMEAVAALSHRWLMHGPLWCWHRSHHEGGERGGPVANDLFALVFALPAMAAIAAGLHGPRPLLWIGVGMTAYGAAYALVHDGIVHRRWPVPRPRGRYLRRVLAAHRIHHACSEREGAVSFGFLSARDPRLLRGRFRAARAQRMAAAESVSGTALAPDVGGRGLL